MWPDPAMPLRFLAPYTLIADSSRCWCKRSPCTYTQERCSPEPQLPQPSVTRGRIAQSSARGQQRWGSQQGGGRFTCTLQAGWRAVHMHAAGTARQLAVSRPHQAARAHPNCPCTQRVRRMPLPARQGTRVCMPRRRGGTMPADGGWAQRTLVRAALAASPTILGTVTARGAQRQRALQQPPAGIRCRRAVHALLTAPAAQRRRA